MTEGRGDGAMAGTPRLSWHLSGSWIDANFYIWIGHADDQRAWSQLAEARDALGAAKRGTPEGPSIADGSEDPHHAEEQKGRQRGQRLVLVVRRRPLVGARPGVRRSVPPPPAERLQAAAASRFQTSCSSAISRRRDHQAAYRRETDPAGLLSPTLDGEETSYFEWLGAGAFASRWGAGLGNSRRSATLPKAETPETIYQ